MTNLDGKLMTAEEAVRRFVRNGSQVAIGGFTVSRNPMCLIREIIRQKVRDLHLVLHSHGQAMDLAIGAGCVKRLEIAYGGVGRFAPTCIRFKQAVQAGRLEVEDYSNYQMSLRFLAGALNLPFIPTKSGLNTDILTSQGFSPDTRQNSKAAPKKYEEIQNPFGAPDDRVLLLPPLKPDLALIHVQYVGDDGTVRIKGLTFADVEQAKSAKTVIVSCEEIVPGKWLREDPDQNTLPSFMVDAVVHAPYGAHPTACHYHYDYDPQHFKEYQQAAQDDERFREYLEKWVYGISDQYEYLDQIGAKALQSIKANPVSGYAVGLDRR